jgi:pyridoxal phosphate enzyme (YggS family)
MGSLHQRIESVREQIEKAAREVQRESSSIQLIAVSKRQPAAAIRAAYACGLRDFGENYVQELVQKAQELADLAELRWHMIGHLQTNKAKVVAKTSHYVHTLDNSRIIDELSRRAQQENRSLGVYVEVNIGNEAQKSGCAPAEAEPLIRQVKSASNLIFLGLMTVGQYVDSAEAARPTFRALRLLRDDVAPGSALSMGMSGDFTVAIQEGATAVRVGTAIFGERT